MNKLEDHTGEIISRDKLERRGFEEWADGCEFNIKRDKYGEYIDDGTYYAWRGWIARKDWTAS